MMIERISSPRSLPEGDSGGTTVPVHLRVAIHLEARTQRQRHSALNAADGTRQLLVSGFWTLLVGATAALLLVGVFGGMGPQGAHSNAGWLTLMVAMMSMPFAILLLLLGGAKWLRNRGLSKAESEGSAAR